MRLLLLGAVIVLATPAAATIFPNPGAITINDCCNVAGPSTTYPSDISVSGLTGTITNVTVTLNGFGHGSPDDVDVLLQAPTGHSMILMSDAGNNISVSALDLTFDDAAAGGLPDEDPLSSGTYQPSNYGPVCSSEPADGFPFGPSPPYGSTLSVFGGLDPNGTWNLYVVDDCGGDTGTISGGWTLNITTSGTPAVTPFTDALGITISDCCYPAGTATPYPSGISVSGLTGTITKVTATLSGFGHAAPDDVDVVLQGPGGEKVLLMSDAGGDADPVSGLDLTFDDAAIASLPDGGVLVSGSYKPSNYGPLCAETDDAFPFGPSPPYGSTMSVFDGLDPNGTWNLYVVDDCAALAGSMSGGWSLDITTNTPTGVVLARFSAIRNGSRVVLRWRTASETELAGFNVYRGAVKLNRALIAAKYAGSARGGSYSLVDRHPAARGSLSYRLQAVSVNGTRSWAAASLLSAQG